MPYNRLKLTVIDYGYTTFFYGNELQNVSVTQQINPITSDISINTTDFTLVSKRDIDYSFQAKQPLFVYFDGQLKSTTFINKATRRSRTTWNISSQDYIGLMDKIPYYGGIYNSKKASEILDDIFSVAKIPYRLADDFSAVTLNGYIPY